MIVTVFSTDEKSHVRWTRMIGLWIKAKMPSTHLVLPVRPHRNDKVYAYSTTNYPKEHVVPVRILGIQRLSEHFPWNCLRYLCLLHLVCRTVLAYLLLVRVTSLEWGESILFVSFCQRPIIVVQKKLAN